MSSLHSLDIPQLASPLQFLKYSPYYLPAEKIQHILQHAQTRLDSDKNSQQWHLPAHVYVINAMLQENQLKETHLENASVNDFLRQLRHALPN